MLCINALNVSALCNHRDSIWNAIYAYKGDILVKQNPAGNGKELIKHIIERILPEATRYAKPLPADTRLLIRVF